MLAVYVATKNDTNGNPRRGWAIYDEHGNLSRFVDEGLEGRAPLIRAVGNGVAETGRVEITPGMYREFKRNQS